LATGFRIIVGEEALETAPAFADGVAAFAGALLHPFPAIVFERRPVADRVAMLEASRG
jgi:hypothetical protein